MEEAKDFSGENLFITRNNEQKIDAFKELNQIHDVIPFLLPQRYANFYARFIIYNLNNFIRFNDMDLSLIHTTNENGFKHLFEGFLDHREVIEQWINVGIEQQEEYQWDMIKIGKTPWFGGIFISCQKDTQGWIYWVRDTGYDIKNNDPEGIRLVTKDIYEYINGLYLSNLENENNVF